MYVCHLYRHSSPLWYERRNYDIYIRHDIMRALFCSVVSGDVYHMCPTKSGLGGMYTSPPGGSMYAYMGRVWRSTTHPTLPEIEKRPRLCKVYEKLGPPHMLHVFAFLTPTVGWLNEYFIKYSSHVLHFLGKGKTPIYG